MPVLDKNEISNFVTNFIVAGVTAVFAKTITNPIERVKLLLQNQHSSLQIITGERKAYKGIIDCFIRIPKEQGFLSLWRGNGVNVIRYFPTQALNFSFNDVYNKRLQNLFGKDGSVTLTRFISGGLAGVSTTLFVYPLEFCQTRITVDVGSDQSKHKKAIKREFTGLSDCVRKVSAADGVKGLYGGFKIAIFSIALYRGLYFGLYDTFKRLTAKEKVIGNEIVPKPHILVGMLLAQSATIIAGSFVYPFDTVCRRLMLDSGRPKELRLFNGVLGVVRRIYKENGITGFYRGAVANMMRGTGAALVLVLYDEVLHYTKWKERIYNKD